MPASEEINVGDRVRFKGDLGGRGVPIGHCHWMTVAAIDENPVVGHGPSGEIRRMGRWVDLVWPFDNEVRHAVNIQVGAVTKEPHPPKPADRAAPMPTKTRSKR